MSAGSRSVSPEPTRVDQGTPAVSGRRVVVDGVSLRYLEAGSGPLLLQVHGHAPFITDFTGFDQQVTELGAGGGYLAVGHARPPLDTTEQ